MSAALTMCGATLSVGVLTVNVRSWWKGKRELKEAAPFASGLIQGSSWTMCTGGLLGWVSVRAADTSNAAGDGAVSRVTGTGGGTLTQGSMGTLTPEGACVVVLALILGFVQWKAAGKTDKKRILGGLLVGTTLCYTAGVAQVMDWVPDAYNSLGAWGKGVLNGEVQL